MREKQYSDYIYNPREDIIYLPSKKIDRIQEVGCGSGETLNIDQIEISLFEYGRH